jgi:outer membrane protein assembly factor BamB
MVGCMVQQTSMPTQGGIAGPAQPTGSAPAGFSLPSPAQLLEFQRGVKHASAIDTRDASDFVPEFSQRVTAAAPEAIFSPDWANNHSPFDTTAYAIYRFEPGGWAGRITVHARWSHAPQDLGMLWIGASNWLKDRWEWHAGAPSGAAELAPDSMNIYKDAQSKAMYVPVVLLGQGASSLLKQVWLTVDGASRRGDWWMQGRDAQHTSCSRFGGPPAATLKWELGLGDPDGGSYLSDEYDAWICCYRQPAVYTADEALYVILDYTEHGLDYYASPLHYITADGSIRWFYQVNGLYNTCYWTSPLIGNDGTLYWSMRSGALVAFDVCADYGTPKWSFGGRQRCGMSAAFGPEGNIYVISYLDAPGEDECFLLAASADGVEQWDYCFGQGGERGVTSPAVAPDGTVYVGTWDNRLCAFNPNGWLKWTYFVGAAVGTSGSGVDAEPSVGKDGTVYFETVEPQLYAVSPAGELVWSVPLAAQAQGTASIAKDGALHVNCADGKLYVFNPDGTPRWSYNTGLSMSVPTIDANGTVYVACDNAHLYAIRADGSLKWTFTASNAIQAQPTLSEDGSLCFLDINGWFYCLGPGEQ